MNRIISVVLAFVICISFSSCSSNEQVDDLILVQAIGIDRYLSGYKITLQTYDTRNTGGEAVVSAEGSNIKPVVCYGDTIYTALKSSELSEGEKVFTGHNMVIVLGETVAENDIREVLDFFVGDEATYPGVKIATVNGSAEEIVSFELGEDILSAVLIDEVIERSVSTGILPRSYLVSVVSELDGIAESCVMPCLEISYDSNEYGSVIVAGTSVFSGGKLIGELSHKESMGLLWLTDQVDTMFFAVEYENVKTGVFIDKVKASIRPKKDADGKVVFDTRIKCDATQMDLSGQISPEPDREKLSIAVREAIEGQCSACLSKTAGELGTDILGIGKLLKMYDKNLYSQYLNSRQELMSDISYNLIIDVNIS